MNMAHLGILILKGQNNLIQQLIQSLSATRYDRHHRNTNHTPQTLIIEFGATLLQLVVHIQRHNHLRVKVDKLGCKEKISLDI